MAKQLFYIPICIDNLAQFFAFGFITPASAFPFNNYAQDELVRHTNVIPLYKKPTAKDKIPSEGIQLSKEEDENLKSAVIIISFDKDDLIDIESSPCLYLNNIIPTYVINEIIFEDKDAQDHFDYLTKKTGRVSEHLLNGIKTKNTGFDKLFDDAKSKDLIDDCSDSYEPEIIDVNILKKMSGYGAALGLCYVMAKNGDLANRAFKELSNIGVQTDAEASILSIKLLNSYLLPNSDADSLKQKIGDEFFDVLVNCNTQEKVLDKLIPLFELEDWDSKVSAFFQKLKLRLNDILKGKIDSTKSEQMSEFYEFKGASQLIEQTTTMFSLLEDTEKLFTQPISTISCEGYVNIAVTYGLRDKFYELPKDVRQIKGLEHFILERMYNYYQIITKHNVEELKPIFGEISTISDILNDSNTPSLTYALADKFGLISGKSTQQVVVNGHSYIPEHPDKMVKVLSIETEMFTSKMVLQKAFDEVDFNVIIELYEAENRLVKERKKFDKQLQKLKS
ncbi:hypothetical protein [Vibrio casei]|uniref:hypothetical protein n=1 Tax=Vibrio casei TaxID=673372 RepID=UPI003F9AD3B1